MAQKRPAASLLRQLREQQGASLREAAAEIGVAPSHLSRVERGEKRGSPEVVSRAAAYYGIDPGVLTDPEVPSDVVRILADHPELVEELRRRYAD